MRRSGIILAVLAGTVLWTAQPALASCAKPPLHVVLEEAEGAFVGKLIARRFGPRPGEVRYAFGVEGVLKGDLGAVVLVRSQVPLWDGLMVENGVRYGLILWGGEGSWSSDRCSQNYSNELLLEFAQDAPTEAPAAQAPAPGPPSPGSPWPWLVATVIAALVAILVRRARRA
jgi:hypothetical protein